MNRIALIEDHARLATLVSRSLANSGIETDVFHQISTAWLALQDIDYGVIVIDRGLPDGDGLQLVQRLRAAGRSTPCLMLTARDALSDRVGGLEAGADDYLTKPFGTGELLARVRAQLRRRAQGAADQAVTTFGDVVLDQTRRVVERAGQPVHLTPIEYRLLAHLAAHPDRVLTHRQLLHAVWGPSHAEDTHYLRVHMANLRKKIEHDPSQARHLVTETGVGYRFVP